MSSDAKFMQLLEERLDFLRRAGVMPLAPGDGHELGPEDHYELPPEEDLHDEIRVLRDLWYRRERNTCGGALHITLDDDNLGDHSIEFCRSKLRDDDHLGHCICSMLLAIPVRRRFFALYDYERESDLDEEDALEEE